MNASIDPERIRELAYRLWEERGRVAGNAEQDWLDAERRLFGEQSTITANALDESLKESFPASDPPASHTPDVPPANADEKWATHRRAKAAQKASKPAAPLIGGAAIDGSGNHG